MSLVSNLMKTIGEIWKHLRKKPAYIVLVLVSLLIFLFGVGQSNSSITLIFGILIFLMPFYLIAIILVEKRHPDDIDTLLKQSRPISDEDLAIHNSLKGEWTYTETVQERKKNTEKISGTVYVNPLNQYELELQNGTQNGNARQSWQSSIAGWIGEKIFVAYTVHSLAPQNNGIEIWHGYVLLNVVYDEKKANTVIRLEGTFYTLNRPRFGTISLKRT
jgi:hypothetical protein